MISAFIRNINHSISAKLIWSFGIILLLSLIGGSFSIFALYQFNTLVQHTLSTQNSLVRDIGDLLNACRIARFHERDFALQARTLGVEQAQKQPHARWEQSVMQMGQIITELNDASRELSNSTPLRAQIEAIRLEYLNYLERAEALFDAYAERGDSRTGALAEWMTATLMVDQLVEENPEIQQSNNQFNKQLMELRSNHLSYLATENEASANYMQQLYNELQAITPTALQEALAREASAFDQFYEATAKLNTIQSNLEAASTNLEHELLTLREKLIGHFTQDVDRLNDEYLFYITVIVLNMFMALAMASLLARILSNQLIKPVLLLADAANKMTAGKQGVRATVLSKDEIGLAAKAFNKMAGQLDELLFKLEVRVGQRTAQLETAAKVAAEASAVRELEPLLESTTNLLVQQFDNIYHAQIFLINKQGAGEWAVLRTSTGPAGQQLLSRHHRLRVGSKSVIGQVTATGHHIIARPDDTDTVHQVNDLLPETACELALSMKREGRVIGALDVQSKVKDGFNEDDVAVLQILADQLTIAVENARLFHSLNSTISETELLFHASRHITTATNQDDILNILTDVAPSSPEMDRFTILFFDEFDADGHPIGARSMRTWTRAEGLITENNGLYVASLIDEIWRALKSGILEVPDITKYASLDNRLYQVFQALGTQSFAIVPLKAANNYLGVILLQRQVPGPLPKSITRIFRLLAKQAAIGLNRFALLEQYEKQVQELRHLRNSFLQLSSSVNMEQLWNALAVTATTLIDAHGCVIYSYNKTQDVMQLVAYHNLDHPELLNVTLLRGEGAAGSLIEEQKPLLIDNYARWSKRSQQLPDIAGAVVAVPLVRQEQLLGAIVSINLQEQKVFEKTDERRLTLLADQASLTIDNIRLLEESQRATKQLTTAAEVSHAASRQLDVNEVLKRAVNLIREQFGYYHVQVFLLDEANEWAELRASTGEVGQALLAKNHRLRVGSRSVIGQVSDRGEHIVARSIKIDPNTVHYHNELLVDTQSELALPMKIGEQVIGALDVQSVAPFAFDAADIKILQTLANQLAVAVQNARLFERTEKSLQDSEARFEASHAISNATSRDEILKALLDHVAPSDTCHISLIAVGVNPHTDVLSHLRLEAVVMSNRAKITAPNVVGQIYSVTAEQRFIIDNFQLGREIVVIDDTANDPRIDPITQSIYAAQNIQAAIILSLPAPRIQVERFILHIGLPHARKILDSEIELLTPIVSEAAIAIENLYLVANLAERTKRLDGANQLASKLLVVNSLMSLNDLAVREIADLMKVEQVGLVFFKEELEVGQVMAQYRRDGPPPVLGLEFPLAGDPSIQWLKEHGQPLAVADIESESLLEPVLPLLKSQGIRSILFIPLFVRGELIGSIGIDALHQVRNWSDIDISLAQNLANLVAAAIDRTNLFEQIRRTLEQTQTLYHASRAINQAKSKDKIAEAIAHYVIDVSDASVALLSLELDANDLIKEARIEGSYLPFRESGVVAKSGLENSSYAHASPVARRNGLISAPQWRNTRLSDRILQIIRRLNPITSHIIITNIQTSQQLSKKEIRFLRLLGIGALISVPIRLPNWPGLIVVTYSKPRALTAGDADRLAAIATQAATTMQNRELLTQTQASLTESQNLYQASVLLGESDTLEGLLDAISPLADSIDPDQIVLLLFDEPVREGERPINFTVKAARTLREELFFVGQSYRVWDFPLFKSQPVHMPLICKDTHTCDLLNHDERQLLRQLNLRGLLYLPLRIGARYIGWVGFNAAGPRTMEDNTVRSLQTIAQQVAIALQNQQLLAEAQRRVWREEQISHITTRLHSTTDPDEILRIGVQELKRTLKIKRAQVWLQPNNRSKS